MDNSDNTNDKDALTPRGIHIIGNGRGRSFWETTDSSTYDLLHKFARANRRYATDAEAILWEYLRGKRLGGRFRRQHPVYGYIPDFVCLSNSLIVEVDGGYHFIGSQQVSDEERTKYLEKRGYHVIRFTNEEVLGDIDSVIKRIKEEMDKTKDNNLKCLNPQDHTIHESEQYEASITREALPSLGGVGGGQGGRLLIFSAPSGSGKSTIINWLMQQHPELKMAFSISCTSRAPRGTERNGVEYFFLTPDEFRQRIANGEFLEHEEVYKDRFYGTLKSQVDKQLDAGENVVFDVDVKGGCNIKQYYGGQALSIFIQPPSIDELRRRLNGRGTDAPEVIEDRIARASFELTFAPKFDRVVINDNLERAEQETYAIVKSFLDD